MIFRYVRHRARIRNTETIAKTKLPFAARRNIRRRVIAYIRHRISNIGKSVPKSRVIARNEMDWPRSLFFIYEIKSRAIAVISNVNERVERYGPTRNVYNVNYRIRDVRLKLYARICFFQTFSKRLKPSQLCKYVPATIRRYYHSRSKI